MSLNPSLEDVRFCPRCGHAANVDFPRSITCPQCGYGAYYNPKPVACAIPVTQNGHLILMRRGFEPRRGHWSMPGGFVDLGETVEDAAVREVREELDLQV
jgi:NADH pyrophosphatase NudC (nudix superfamily)